MKIQTFTLSMSLIVLLLACGEEQEKKSDAESTNGALTSTSFAINCEAFCSPIRVTFKLDSDACNLQSQKVLNCFAWSSFLALNWNAGGIGIPDTTAKASQFGVPGDFKSTVWESYPSVDDIFNQRSINLKSINPLTDIKRIHKLSKIEHTLSKVNQTRLNASADEELKELFQAEGTWLTDQRGNLVWYEVRVNVSESDFINKHQLYDLSKLQNYANQNKGVWLPTGSIEIKAAWKVVPEKEVDSTKKYYKMSKAMVPTVIGFDKNKQPIYGEYTQQYLALVGLHIIRKTLFAPQFIWMTFEHVYNAPTENQIDSSMEYSFYNKASKATPNVSPNPNKDSLNSPVQVVRIANNAITNDIKILNKQVQNLIRQSNPNSVWQFYQLINVQWPQNPVQDTSNNSIVPLQMGGITPLNIANVTMETYIQIKNCMCCHQYGGISGSTYPTDYSFVFLRAKSEKDTTIKNMNTVKNFIKSQNGKTK